MYSLDDLQTVRFIQVTDTHLFAESGRDLLGVKTLESLESVLNSIACYESGYDFFLLSGDLSQDGSLLSYQYLADTFSIFKRPSFWFCGNHDNQQNMQLAAKEKQLETVIRSQHWQVVLLNSQVPGQVHGHLADDQLQLLEQALTERPDLHTLISFHHHPIDMQCEWIDGIGIKNSDKFHSLIKQHKNVKAVLWGHVHQASDRTINGVRYLSTPSTCIQFKPEQKDFALDDIAPGYRNLQLNADGTIESEVKRVKGINFEIDKTAAGY